MGNENKINSRTIRQLKNSLKGLDELKWINERNQLEYSRILGKIKQKLDDILGQIETELANMNLEVGDPDVIR